MASPMLQRYIHIEFRAWRLRRRVPIGTLKSAEKGKRLPKLLTSTDKREGQAGMEERTNCVKRPVEPRNATEPMWHPSATSNRYRTVGCAETLPIIVFKGSVSVVFSRVRSKRDPKRPSARKYLLQTTRRERS